MCIIDININHGSFYKFFLRETVYLTFNKYGLYVTSVFRIGMHLRPFP